MSKSAISLWESGTNGLSDAMVKSICREFRASEAWLRDGEGEMMQDATMDGQLAAFVENLQGPGDEFKQRFVAMLSGLTEDQWELLADMAERLAAGGGSDAPDAESGAPARDADIPRFPSGSPAAAMPNAPPKRLSGMSEREKRELTVEERVELYRAELEREEKAGGESPAS